MDDVRSDCGAGRAVVLNIFSIRCYGDVVVTKGAGGPVGLEVTGFSVHSGAAADDAGS